MLHTSEYQRQQLRVHRNRRRIERLNRVQAFPAQRCKGAMQATVLTSNKDLFQLIKVDKCRHHLFVGSQPKS
jgi:hypothetical protein